MQTFKTRDYCVTMEEVPEEKGTHQHTADCAYNPFSIHIQTKEGPVWLVNVWYKPGERFTGYQMCSEHFEEGMKYDKELHYWNDIAKSEVPEDVMDAFDTMFTYVGTLELVPDDSGK